jgi:hypothetical protein
VRTLASAAHPLAAAQNGDALSIQLLSDNGRALGRHLAAIVKHASNVSWPPRMCNLRLAGAAVGRRRHARYLCWQCMAFMVRQHMRWASCCSSSMIDNNVSNVSPANTHVPVIDANRLHSRMPAGVRRRRPALAQSDAVHTKAINGSR